MNVLVQGLLWTSLARSVSVQASDLKGNSQFSTVKCPDRLPYTILNTYDPKEISQAISACSLFINKQFSEHYFTPMHLAVKKENEDAINQLFKAGAKVNEVDGNGLTPLLHAAIKGNTVIVENLLSKGANHSMLYGLPSHE